jgi:hypothetical protein
MERFMYPEIKYRSPKRCGRCGCNATHVSMSFFTDELICNDCEKKERSHPKYELAVKKMMAALKKGNFAFTGIGKPSDL